MTLLKTRSVAIATLALAAAAVLLLGWQLTSRRPAGDAQSAADRAGTSASGVVTGGSAPRRIATAEPASTAGPVDKPSQAAVAAAPKTPATAASTAPTPSTPAIKHRVAPRPSTPPPILPTEVNTAVGKALGPRALARFFYVEPLARRFVASVDALGQQPAPTSLWLLRPAPGTLRLAGGANVQDTRLLAAANSRRYTDFISWVESTDNQRLLTLYARLYPLLQQSYVELGHPDGYFNDRLIEVIDQLLATPQPRGPLRLKVSNRPPAPGTPPQPRYEFSDQALENLSTGQKLLLRLGPLQAYRLKAKLRLLRRGLLALGKP